MDTISDFKKGDKVMFGRGFGEKTLGEVVKVNRVKLKVKQLEVRGTFKAYPVGTVWTVPTNLCSKVAGDAPSDVEAAKSEIRAKLNRPFQMTEPRVKRPETVILNDIKRIYCALSPENLHCDGEISRSAAARKGAALNRELRACFEELGRRVSEAEAFGF